MREAVPYFYPPLSGPTDGEVEAAEEVLAQRKAASDQQKRDTLLRCTSQIATGIGCGRLSRVADLTYIQTHWTTASDDWRLGEGQWRCRECGHINRLYKTPEIEKMKPFFRAVEETY